MTFSDDPLWQDTLAYAGGELRRAMVMFLMANGAAGGAVAGVRPGDPGLVASLAGLNITVTAGVAAVTRAGQGVYLTGTSSAWTGTVNAQPTSPNSRIDLLYLRVWDTDVDSTGLRKGDIVYLAGTAATSPVAPTPGATEIYIPLAKINVPSSGSGSPSVDTTVRPVTVGPGGIGTNTTGSGSYPGQYADDGALKRWNGSIWEPHLYLGTGGTVDLGDVTVTRSASGIAQVNGGLSVTGTVSTPGIGGTLTAHKTVDKLLTSTTTLTADADMIITVAANAMYAMDSFLQFTGAAGGDIKIDWLVPASASFLWAALGTGTINFTDNDASVIANNVARGARGNGATVQSANSRGTLTTGATAGTLQMRWAQNTTSGTPTTLKAGTWMRLTRIG